MNHYISLSSAYTPYISFISCAQGCRFRKFSDLHGNFQQLATGLGVFTHFSAAPGAVWVSPMFWEMYSLRFGAAVGFLSGFPLDSLYDSC